MAKTNVYIKENNKMYLFDSEDAIKMEILICIIKRWFYLNAKDVSDLYNKIFNKNVNPTTCASCTRQRYEELLRAYKIFTNNEVTEEQCARNMGQNVRRMYPKDIAHYKENKAKYAEKEIKNKQNKTKTKNGRGEKRNS